ncbi:MAG: type III polyketide synthase [Verrucomicrobia bacterium]|nr:type III polyketide synthase [Verrucomicrobiota bacterium]
MPWIQHIETLVPESSYSQEYACEVMQTWTQDKKAKRYINQVYAGSNIDKRHSVVKDFGKDGSDSLSLYRTNGTSEEPSTGERNKIYTKESRILLREIALNAVKNCPGIEAEDITHLITVSCTGFYNPGPDLEVVDALKLPPSVQRFHLGFMGCYAAFPAMKMASQFCQADPTATVLIVCVELCSLHLRLKDDLDTILANSVFADGAAAVLVNNRKPEAGHRALELKHFACELTLEGAQDMAWDIGDYGFNLVLSKYIARIIGAEIEGTISKILADCDLGLDDIDTWAVHPGGRAILDKIESSLKISPDQIKASRNVMAEFGNMSSPTVLFILNDILRNSETKNGDRICAMAFGPGLTIETATIDAVIS